MTAAHKSNPRTLFARLLDRVREQATPAPQNYRVPVEVYTSEEHYRHERESLLLGMPVLLAHESQLPEPGDAIVHDWLGLPLVTVRDKSGEIGTFMNVCRHRGMRLVEDTGPVNLRSFVCRYHQWTYGLDGKLRNIPLEESFADIDPGDFNLVSLPTEVRHGLVWMQATPGADMDLDSFLSDIGADFEEFGIPGMHFFRQHERRIACNWKLVQDAFLDGYHVIRLHKNTVGSFFPDCIADSDMVGDHLRSVVARNEIQDALTLPESEWDLRRHCTFSYTIFPNSVVIMHPDYTSLLGLYPTAPDETIFVHTMLVPEPPATDKARDHYDRSFELIDSGVFQAEDIAVCIGAQAGMASGANDYFTCGAHENGVMKFHERLNYHLQPTGGPTTS